MSITAEPDKACLTQYSYTYCTSQGYVDCTADQTPAECTPGVATEYGSIEQQAQSHINPFLVVGLIFVAALVVAAIIMALGAKFIDWKLRRDERRWESQRIERKIREAQMDSLTEEDKDWLDEHQILIDSSDESDEL